MDGAGCGVSFGACGGVVCGALGCLAAPAMVVLGDAAASFVHVHFYSLGRYHYVVDIFGGIVTGTLGYVIGKWIMRREAAYTSPWEAEGAELSSVR